MSFLIDVIIPLILVTIHNIIFQIIYRGIVSFLHKRTILNTVRVVLKKNKRMKLIFKVQNKL